MKKNRSFIILIIGIIAFLTLIGYRLTAESAAKAHAFLEKDAQKIEEIDFEWGKAYIYKIDDYYRTVLAIRSGFLWRSPVSTSLKNVDDKKDDLRTVGLASVTIKNKSITILAIKNSDKSVAYVEAGPELDRVKKEINPEDIVIFSWDKPFYTHDIEPIALSKDNEKLYRYGYPEGTNVFRDKDLKWYKTK
ncbi:hypothetical protein R9X47_00610 [Wukongibacter baidiensis]|uniref:hypothetical protein n=1 Tax=Wukongibacter baidiensis TaxID=1723361 RepID=UPI003D7F7BFE